MHTSKTGDPGDVAPPVPQHLPPVLVHRLSPLRPDGLLGQLLGPVGQGELGDLGGVVVALLGPLSRDGIACEERQSNQLRPLPLQFEGHQCCLRKLKTQ